MTVPSGTPYAEPVPPVEPPKKRKLGKIAGFGCLGIVGIFVLTAVISGLSAGDKKTDAKPAPANASAPASVGVDPKIAKAAAEAVFADAASKGDPKDLAGVKPSVLASEGYAICKQLKAGQSIPDVIAKEKLGFNDAAVGAMLAASPALCPDQQQKVTDGLAALG